MATAEPDIETLLQRAGQGERGARSLLLQRHRQRLRRMIALRLDRRVSPRVDPPTCCRMLWPRRSKRCPTI
jgi:RNA polymerase sigma-70 factor (ECF subfamily)